MAVADNEIGDSAHRTDALDQAAVDGVPQPFCSARIFQLAEEQVAEQPDGICLIGHRKRRQPRQPIGQGAAGHVTVLVDTVGQEMKRADAGSNPAVCRSAFAVRYEVSSKPHSFTQPISDDRSLTPALREMNKIRSTLNIRLATPPTFKVFNDQCLRAVLLYLAAAIAV